MSPRTGQTARAARDTRISSYRAQLLLDLVRLSEEIAPLDETWAAKHAERAHLIHEAHRNGMSQRQIAPYAGISHERVGQLIRRRAAKGGGR